MITAYYVIDWPNLLPMKRSLNFNTIIYGAFIIKTISIYVLKEKRTLFFFSGDRGVLILPKYKFLFYLLQNKTEHT